MTLAILTTLWMPTDAQACGGFFCNRDPIDQAGEDIVFKVDTERGRTEMHVQVAYEGSAEEFAWIVPVGGEPELKLSTDALFQSLEWVTAPRFSLETKGVGDCDFDVPFGYYYGYALDASAGGSPPSPSPEDDGVTVVSEQEVGPYETVVLRAESSAQLLDWLQNNQYILPDELDPVLAPYVADEAYFVALRLGKNSDVGDLQPLALSYPGTAMSVPIRLTAIAATDDMRMRAFVFGDERAVPESYLHVVVNDLVVDWFRWGSNWEDAITIAANEAGGNAFATDYSGPADVLENALYQEGRFDTERLAASTDVFSFFDELLSQGFSGSSLMLELFREFVPIPAEFADTVFEQDFYNCLRCDPWASAVAAQPFDAAGFAAAIQTRIVEPLVDAQALIDDSAHLTRLTSSISPVEMTVDPTFVFNADMEQSVPLERSATVELLCEEGKAFTDVERRLVLADGRAYRLPSMQWFWDRGTTEYEFLSGLMDDFALLIERTSGEGPPVPLYDGRERAVEIAEGHNATFGPLPGACGCSTTSGPLGASLGLAGALGLVLLRRRRS